MQTLHCMYIVNAGTGFKKVLWPAAQKFLDTKTLSKIHVRRSIILSNLISVCPLSSGFKLISTFFVGQVLDPKSLGKLLEAIDPWFDFLCCVTSYSYQVSQQIDI